MSTNTYTKNQHSFKHCSQTYRNMGGIQYEQWTDNCSSKDEANQMIETFEIEYPGHKFVFRKISDGFRIYKSVNKVQ